MHLTNLNYSLQMKLNDPESLLGIRTLLVVFPSRKNQQCTAAAAASSE